MPAISVVMPTYNQAAFLPEAVASVLGQTVGDLELILVDDASTDATPRLLAELASRGDPRVRCLRHAQNRGASAALNTGFAQATGEYLTWLASDNRYAPHALERLLAGLEANPHADLAYAAFANIDEAGHLLDYVFQEPYWPGLLQVNPGTVGMAFLYTRRLQAAVGDYADLVANDLDYWLRAARRFQFTFVPEVLGDNRKHAAMQTVVRHEQMAVEVARLLEDDRRQHPVPLPWPRLLERVHGLRRAAQQCLRAVRLARDEAGTEAAPPLIIAHAGDTGALLAAVLQAQGLPAEARSLEDITPPAPCLAVSAADAHRLRQRGCPVLGLHDEADDAEDAGWGKDF
ncbi:MAG: glycosyltransferase [Desulfovibrio sp.]|nr:glycosyltransferase [Desulfovibrio sp.]MCA1985838.1 glycosyltransferase [Desulfovibrio sp.]